MAASHGYVSQKYCVLNGMNSCSTAMFIAEIVRTCSVLEVGKETIMTFRFIIEKYLNPALLNCVKNIKKETKNLFDGSSSIKNLYKTKL
jgi:hypothetical protein